MAYQNVGTPRFYVNLLEWLDVSGYLSINNAFRTLPVIPKSFDAIWYNVPHGTLNSKSFIALLGHTFGTDNAPDGDFSFAGSEGYWASAENIVNITYPYYNGFSIATFDGSGLFLNISLQGSFPINVGSIVIGSYFDMPVSPNLSLSFGREYGSIKEITTHNGSSISNTMASRQPNWGIAPAWELYNDPDEWYTDYGDTSPISRSGRRTWQLKFSFIDNSDIWGSNQSLSDILTTSANYDSDDISNGKFNYDLLTDDNFFSQVWHKTLGGTLPFVFQPDSNNKSPDHFAICRFKNDTLKVSQSAFNVYDISLSIEEVW